MYKLWHAFILIFTFFSAIAHTNKYSNVHHLNIASVAWEDEEWPNNESYYDYLYRVFGYQSNMQKFKKRRSVFNLYEELCTNQPVIHNALYDTISAQDLALFAGKTPKDKYIAEIIDRTNTELGKVAFYGLLGNPTIDIKELRSRQNIIKYLLANPEWLDLMIEQFQRMAESENLLLSLWQQDGFVTTTKRRYFSIPYFEWINNYCNTSPKMLEIKSVIGHQERALLWLSGIAAIGILSLYGVAKTAQITVPNFIERIAQRLQGSGHRLIAFLSSFETPWIDVGMLSILGAVMCGFTNKEDYEWVRDNIVLEMLLQKKMIMIAQFFRSVMVLSELLEQCPEFIEICPAAAGITNFMKHEATQEPMRQFLIFCQTTTLQGNESIFSYQGRTLAAFKLVYNCKKIIEPLLMMLGDLDAYISCARLYNEFQNKRVQFCFVEYVQEKNPLIEMENFWNPMIDPEKVIANDLHLFGPCKRNMIITGPNAGGKSTLIKGIPVNLILAQTIGLAAASSATITPFFAIATYLNIVDDIAAGNSLFKAQVLRAQEMVNLVEGTPTTQFSFIALDEMFNGTSANESMAAAFSVINHIGKNENNICAVATHFPLLTKLEEKSSAFENYKVSVNVDETKICYPFKLEKGISHQHVALDILKLDGYNFTILEEASKILAQHA